MFKKSAFYLSGILLLIAGCSGYEKLLKSSDYMLKYKEANRYYAEKDYYKAQTLYDQIAPIFRGTAQADTVYFYQAMSYYKQSDYIMAGHYFSTFTGFYGGSPFVEQSDYLTAYCYYMDSPRPELDQQSTIMAIQSFQLFLIKYPASEKCVEARKIISELQDKLVEKSFISAKLYYDLEDYKASLVALNNSLLEYPESTHREQILYMIVKSSYMYADKSISTKKKERYQQAIDEYYSFKAEFPDGEYIKDATRYFRLSSKYLGDNVQSEETEENKIN